LVSLNTSFNLRPRMSHLNIVIVGGGASGTFLALELAERLDGRCRITMFDRHGQFGRGVAYSATAKWHRLNVPAAKMGGRSDGDVNGFADWLERRGHARATIVVRAAGALRRLPVRIARRRCGKGNARDAAAGGDRG
jgi:uncharacterized NAD(P)/FAD-binding protein YdhS